MPGGDAAAGRARRRVVRSAARVVRVGDQVAFVVFDQWCAGAITVPVPSMVLQRALRLTHDQLVGALASAVIDTGVLLDHEVRPRAWRPATSVPSAPPPTRVSSAGGRW